MVHQYLVSNSLNGDKKIFLVRLLQNNFKILTMYIYAFLQSNSKVRDRQKHVLGKRNPFLIPFGGNIHDHKYLSKKVTKRQKRKGGKKKKQLDKGNEIGEELYVFSRFGRVWHHWLIIWMTGSIQSVYSSHA